MAKTSFESLSEIEQKLLKAAKAVLRRSYSPYSGFQVGAAVLTEDNKIITGTNFESASYGDSICAERAALLRANSQGHGDECVAIAIVTRNKNSPTKEVSSPCGSCRQLILEAAQRSRIRRAFKIIMATTQFDKVEASTIGALLPSAFGPEDLEENSQETKEIKNGN